MRAGVALNRSLAAKTVRETVSASELRGYLRSFRITIDNNYIRSSSFAPTIADASVRIVSRTYLYILGYVHLSHTGNSCAS